MLNAQRKYTPFFILIAVLAFFAGCSTQNHYKTLSFFFDGVPQATIADTTVKSVKKNSSDTTSKLLAVNKSVGSNCVIHPPFRDQNCDVCHDKNAVGITNAPLQKICYQCHDDFAKKYTFLHGPIASGYCVGCHNPHSSDLPKLHKRKAQDLCLYCHELKVVLKNEVHTDIGETNCTECHNPHGGSEIYLLK
jgi:predicted CXXCH cytochrome family protein